MIRIRTIIVMIIIGNNDRSKCCKVYCDEDVIIMMVVAWLCGNDNDTQIDRDIINRHHIVMYIVIYDPYSLLKLLRHLILQPVFFSIVKLTKSLSCRYLRLLQILIFSSIVF